MCVSITQRETQTVENRGDSQLARQEATSAGGCLRCAGLLPLFSARQPWEGHVGLGVGNMCPRGRVRSDQSGKELPAHVKASNTFSARGGALERGGLITQSPSIGAPQDPGTRPTEGVPLSTQPPPLRSPALPDLPPLSTPGGPHGSPGPLCTILKWNKFCSPDDSWSGDTPSWRSLPRRRSTRF